MESVGVDRWWDSRGLDGSRVGVYSLVIASVRCAVVVLLCGIGFRLPTTPTSVDLPRLSLTGTGHFYFQNNEVYYCTIIKHGLYWIQVSVRVAKEYKMDKSEALKKYAEVYTAYRIKFHQDYDLAFTVACALEYVNKFDAEVIEMETEDIQAALNKGVA